MENELSIVIPCKNEEKTIGLLLNSLLKQSYNIKDVPIYVADAKSKDNTRRVVLSYNKILNIKIVSGGLPSKGRNSGARQSKSKYILFLDADIILGNRKLIEKTIKIAKIRKLECVTTNIFPLEKDFFAYLLYTLNNLAQFLSKFHKPFATGMFLLLERKRFSKLKGFNEKVHYAEDYFLTKKIKNRKFGIVFGYILTTNRRFKKMGYLNIAKRFFKVVINSNSDNYFLKEDKEYWS